MKNLDELLTDNRSFISSIENKDSLEMVFKLKFSSMKDAESVNRYLKSNEYEVRLSEHKSWVIFKTYFVSASKRIEPLQLAESASVINQVWEVTTNQSGQILECLYSLMEPLER